MNFPDLVVETRRQHSAIAATYQALEDARAEYSRAHKMLKAEYKAQKDALKGKSQGILSALEEHSACVWGLIGHTRTRTTDGILETSIMNRTTLFTARSEIEGELQQLKEQYAGERQRQREQRNEMFAEYYHAIASLEAQNCALYNKIQQLFPRAIW